ncbi:MAG: TetR/AcrR family transcriptional regulator [Polyangia bacterium]|jgi:TetR/AcrR family transcriptional repressor of bet genes|nr:TetR/AcrR family transcriptional regulator [Polyangia bacterium]
MPRPSNTRERRDQIASALIHVMSERGYERASIGQIAHAAGLTQGLVHYHFGSKQEILISVLSELRRRHGKELETALERAGSRPIRRLEAFIDLHLGPMAYRDGEALACWIFLSGQALMEPSVRSAFEGVLEGPTSALEEIIEEGLAVGDFGRGEPSSSAIALMATIHGYFLLGATARSMIPKGSAAKETRAIASGLLAPSEPLGNPDSRGRDRQ